MYYTGIDLHKFTSYLTTVDSSGKIVKQQNIKNVAHNFVQYFSNIKGKHITTVESKNSFINLFEMDNYIFLTFYLFKMLYSLLFFC